MNETTRGAHMRCPSCGHKRTLHSINKEHTSFACEHCGVESTLYFTATERCFIRAKLVVVGVGNNLLEHVQ